MIRRPHYDYADIIVIVTLSYCSHQRKTSLCDYDSNRNDDKDSFEVSKTCLLQRKAVKQRKGQTQRWKQVALTGTEQLT